VISNCKTIEIYTETFEQYWKTINGIAVDDTDDISTYSFSINLESLSNHVTLKLASKNTQFWIYGINLKLLDSSKDFNQSSNSTINMQNVDFLLNNSNVKLTDNANLCKTFVNQVQILKCKPNQQNISEIIENSLSKLLTKETTLESLKKFSLQENSSQQIDLNSTAHRSLLDDLTSNFKKEIQSLENRMTQKLEEKFDQLERSQEQKFNEILKKLEQNLKQNDT
jgi:hypothetical protein